MNSFQLVSEWMCFDSQTKWIDLLYVWMHTIEHESEEKNNNRLADAKWFPLEFTSVV